MSGIWKRFDTYLSPINYAKVQLTRTKIWTGFHVESRWTVAGVSVKFDFQADCQQDMKK